LSQRDLSMVTDLGDIIVPQGKYTLSVGGGQPGMGAPSVTGNFEVNGSVMLPE
jgi:beta-glucosidase